MTPGPRYVAKEHQLGRFRRWAVYDREHGSMPAILAGKRIPQDHVDEGEAQRIADRMNEGWPHDGSDL
jgi:hypothetical protein